MVREHQTRNLEIPDSRFARSGMTVSLHSFHPIITKDGRNTHGDA
jgi:hypothetical protein